MNFLLTERRKLKQALYNTQSIIQKHLCRHWSLNEKVTIFTFQEGSRLNQTFLHDLDFPTLTRCEGHELQDDAGRLRLPGATFSRNYDALVLVSVPQEPVRRAGNRVAATSNWDTTRNERLAVQKVSAYQTETCTTALALWKKVKGPGRMSPSIVTQV
jgi:hypothetical protein